MQEQIMQMGTVLPEELRLCKQWLVWRFEGAPNAKGKLPKVPYYTNGKRRTGKQGSETDRAALVTFSDASAAILAGGYQGLGFAFLPHDGLIGIDIDDCLDPETGELSALAGEVLALVPDSYCEKSPSGNGLHIIAHSEAGETFKDNKKGLEVFAGRQFFTVTGQAFGEDKALTSISPETLAKLKVLVKGEPVETARPPATSATGIGGRYALAALDNACRKIAATDEGGRNATLNNEALGIARLVAGGELAESVARAALKEAGQLCGLDLPEIISTLNSAFKAGMKQPRTAPERAGSNAHSVPEAHRANLPMIQQSGTIAYTVDERGVFFIGQDKEGNQLSPRWICSPLFVLAKTRDAKSGNWGRLLEWQDDDSVVHRWAMPLELLEGDSVDMRRELARLGLTIASGKGAGDLLASYIKVWRVEDRAKCVNKLGWHGEVYVLPDKAIGSRDEQVVFQNANAVEPALAVSGTLEQWRANVAALASGNSRMIFGISTAFAGPLAYLANEDSGGFHLRGASSTGKTTALKIGASVWGDPDQYVRLWRATANGLEGMASLHNDNTLFLDELSQCSPREAGEAAYMLGNGQGKTRASKTGAAREVATWRTVFVSTGEETLASLVAKAGIRLNAGQAIRLADIEADAGAGLGAFDTQHSYQSPAALALAMKDGSSRYFGAAGVAWLQWIVCERNRLPDMITSMVDKFIDSAMPDKASGQVYRVAKRFGLVAVAGELATGAGITGWQQGEAETAILTCFKSWLECFGGGGKSEERAMLSQVRAFFEVHGASRFDDIQGFVEQRIVNRAGFFRTDDNGRRTFYVLPEVFKRDVCEGFDAKAVARLLAEQGWFDLDSKGKSTRNERLPGMGQTRCYVFNGKMWESEE